VSDRPPWSAQLVALLEERFVETMVRQMRLQRLVGDTPPQWSLDLRRGVLEIAPGWRFGVDVLGTESRNDDTFVWAWDNPSFRRDQTRSARALREVGAQRSIPELVQHGALPLDRMEASLACLLGVGVTDADAYFVGERDEGDMGFLLHGGRLRDAPFDRTDLPFALTRVAAMPVSHRNAIEAFARSPSGGYEVELERWSIAFRRDDDRIEVEFDDYGRLADMRFHGGAPEPGDEASAAEEGETETIAELSLPDGELVVCDPFLVSGSVHADPLRDDLPLGPHDVDVWLVDDPAGGHRVQIAYVFFSDEEVVEWGPAGATPTDSGVLCFATPAALRRHAQRGEAARDELDEALTAAAQPTWFHAAKEGLVAVSTGFGAGEYELAWGLDAVGAVACLAVDCLAPSDLEAEPGAPPQVSGSPGVGLQRATMLPQRIGSLDARNMTILPPSAARKLLRTMIRLLDQSVGGRVNAGVTPEFDDDGNVPARIRVSGTGGGRPFNEVVEVER